MAYETIRFETDGSVATITLNRPQVLNAVSVKMHEELRGALKAVTDSRAIRCLVLTGEGRAFCAGQDLTDRAVDGAKIDFAESIDKNYNRLIRTLRGLEIPVVTAVNGIAAGAGANIALTGDIVIAARSAEFIQAFIRIGLVPDCGGTYYLPRLIGRARAMALSMLGDKLPAPQAEAWGLIWKCVDDDKLKDETRALAQRLGGMPTKAIALMRRAFEASIDNTLDQQLDLERDLQLIATKTEDFGEGMRSFIEKRPAAFKGR
ncbi:MAG: 2-(1,2-epoxy-1,2-dihydrophenyl)acetyl-CoA isomerase [Alphaproteobacteria bacterium]|nr:2-(1,2-epoxy-1,2-dihydrophenyl)acetyl-CoA isomerase [Alphaproteobacteria bacterium]